MNPLFAAATDLQRLAIQHGWRTTVIGGLAVQRWGEPRQSRDVDVALLTGFGGEARFIDGLLESFSPRRPDARQFALERRVLLLQHPNGTPIDVSLGLALAMPVGGCGHQPRRDRWWCLKAVLHEAGGGADAFAPGLCFDEALQRQRVVLHQDVQRARRP